MRFSAVLTWSIAAAFGSAVHAASVSFEARLVEIIVDVGGVYSGTTVDTVFTGDFNYPNTAGPSTINEPDEANYELTGAHTLQAGVTDGNAIDINIQNNQPLGEESAALLNDLFTIVPPAMGDDPVDTWTASALEFGAFEADPTPGNGDDTELLYNGVGYEFTLLSLDDTLYDNLDYRPIPPALSQVDAGVFVLREGDSNGNVLFEAIGIIELMAVDEIILSSFE